MTIHLTPDLERIVLDAIRAGRYTRGDDVIRDALLRLGQTIEPVAESSSVNAEAARQAKPLTKQEFQRHLVKIGLLDQADDGKTGPENSGDELIDQEGEIVSEVVIRERLIEWLTGFLGS